MTKLPEKTGPDRVWPSSDGAFNSRSFEVGTPQDGIYENYTRVTRIHRDNIYSRIDSCTVTTGTFPKSVIDQENPDIFTYQFDLQNSEIV